MLSNRIGWSNGDTHLNIVSVAKNFDELIVTDRELIEKEEGSFFLDDADMAPARELLARLVAAFCERSEDWSLASSLEAVEEEEITDLESEQADADDGGPTITSQKSHQRSSSNNEDERGVNGPLETIAGLMGK